LRKVPISSLVQTLAGFAFAMGAACVCGGGGGALSVAGCWVAAVGCDWPMHNPGAIASNDASAANRKSLGNLMG
jgi:hypothetical protein